VRTLGIALLEAIDSDDPTALVGLPLIRTCRCCARPGWTRWRRP
jgi:septum formation protein